MGLLYELPYLADTTTLFDRISHLPWAAFLDSGRPLIGQGRFDILVAEPVATLTTYGAQTQIRRGGQAELRSTDPFELVREYLGERSTAPLGLPFAGGALGWFGYDLARRPQRLSPPLPDAGSVPDMAVGIYDWAVVVDHWRRRSYLVGEGRYPETLERWDELAERFSAAAVIEDRDGLRLKRPLESNFSRRGYGEAFRRVRHYIREGDCYQVNLAQRFAAPVGGDAWSTYRQLRRFNPAPFGAFINHPEAQVLCASPERFLRLREGVVETWPIKGTRPRGADPATDLELQRHLAASAKDRAENVMIVDLLRNDLGRVCIPGSIEVPNLFEVQTFATVHHLVSSVRGRLAMGQDATNLLRACFPGGSITGAPKIRAMEIIDELEPHRRGIYCGAIGYLGYNGDMDTNIVIRTMVHNAGWVKLWAGGGIVWDSQEEAEFQETLDKASALFQVLSQPETGGDPPSLEKTER
ncbi:MAG: aminodeoxychorismate synthase component I [Chromatiales bacterium]|nr:aminodeoxychorismate synthase component I [Chromatiales bacterium]